jgi:integrase/recombinase XerD
MSLGECFEAFLEREVPRLRLVSELTFNRAIDDYEGELARRGKSASTRRSYRRNLVHFARMTRDKPPATLTLEDYERFTDRWVDAKPSTLASAVSLAHGFSTYLYEKGITETNVAAPLKRPRRQRPEDTEVITVSASDVQKMLSACEDMQELVCLASAIYLGARRAALARVRRSDVDLVNGTVRLLEKGGKVNVKPLPDEYQALLVAAERDGLWQSPSDYLIPNRRPASVKRRERSDKVVWETVKRVAKRAGVRSHVHALRAAFAVAFDEAHPDQVIALQELLGHTRIETTLVYLRRKDRAKAMEQVRDLSWGLSVPSSQALKAHTGFEPVPWESGIVEPLLRRLRELTTAATEDVPSS